MRESGCPGRGVYGASSHKRIGSRGLRSLAAACLAATIGCGGGGSGGEAPRLVLNAPGDDVTVTMGRDVSIDGFVEDNDSLALVTIVADRDGNPDTIDDQIVISPTVSVEGGALFQQLWSTQSVPPGTYTIFGTVTDGTNRVETIAGGTVSVIDRRPPDAFVFEPAEDIELARGERITVQWEAGTTDGNGTVSMFLDRDGNASTNEDRVVLFEDTPIFPGRQTTIANTTGLPLGQYRVILIVDDGLGVPRSVTSAGTFDIQSVPAGLQVAGTGDDFAADVVAHLDGDRTILASFQFDAELRLLEAAGVDETEVTTLDDVSSLATNQAVIVRTRNDGTTRWTVQLDSDGDTTADRLTELPDGGVVVAGTFRAPLFFRRGAVDEIELTSRGERDVYIVRLGPGGSIVWARSLGSDDDDRVGDVASFVDGAFGLCGRFDGGEIDVPVTGGAPLTATGAGATGFVARFGFDGQPQWVLAASAGPNDALRLASLAGGALVLAGTGTGAPGTAADGIPGFYLIRYDANGQTEWFRRDGGDAVTIRAMEAVGDNFILAGGFTGAATFTAPTGPAELDPPEGESAAFVARYNSTGTLNWLRRSEGVASAEARAIALLGNGSLAIVGTLGDGLATFQGERLFGNGNDLFVVSFTALGIAERADVGGGPTGDATPFAAFGTPAGAVVVAGSFLDTPKLSELEPTNDLPTTDGFVAEFFAIPELIIVNDE